MEDKRVQMVREHLEDIPLYPMPQGFHVRAFQPGDEEHWAEVEHAAGEFESREAALERFRRDFGGKLDELRDRSFFVVDEESGRVVGTATAWYDPDFLGENYGRVHWVAILPEFQGRKLAKPLMCVVMNRLKQSHTKACLATHTRCDRAINMYLELGFRPYLSTPTCEEAWGRLAELLDHPALKPYRKTTEP